MHFLKAFFILVIQIGLAYSLSCYRCEDCEFNQTNVEIIKCIKGQTYCNLGIKNNFYFQGCIRSDEIDKVIRFFESNKICDVEFCNKNFDKTSKNWSAKLKNDLFLFLFLVLFQIFIKRK